MRWGRGLNSRLLRDDVAVLCLSAFTWYLSESLTCYRVRGDSRILYASSMYGDVMVWGHSVPQARGLELPVKMRRSICFPPYTLGQLFNRLIFPN